MEFTSMNIKYSAQRITLVTLGITINLKKNLLVPQALGGTNYKCIFINYILIL